jgi:hypothetical protein
MTNGGFVFVGLDLMLMKLKLPITTRRKVYGKKNGPYSSWRNFAIGIFAANENHTIPACYRYRRAS